MIYIRHEQQYFFVILTLQETKCALDVETLTAILTETKKMIRVYLCVSACAYFQQCVSWDDIGV